jgi:hypothetical protein
VTATVEKWGPHNAAEMCGLGAFGGKSLTNLMPIIFALAGLPVYVASSQSAPLTRMHPAFSPCRAARPSHRAPRTSIHRFLFGSIEKLTHFL